MWSFYQDVNDKLNNFTQQGYFCYFSIFIILKIYRLIQSFLWNQKRSVIKLAIWSNISYSHNISFIFRYLYYSIFLHPFLKRLLRFLESEVASASLLALRTNFTDEATFERSLIFRPPLRLRLLRRFFCAEDSSIVCKLISISFCRKF